MENNIVYDRGESFLLETFAAGHSQMKLVSQNDEIIVFEGIKFMEIPRIVKELRLERLPKAELERKFADRKSLIVTNSALWRLRSGSENYFVLGLSVKIYDRSGKLIAYDCIE